MAERRLQVAAADLDRGRAIITGDNHHYLFRVLRLAVDDALIVFDGQGREADARIDVVSADEATLLIDGVRAATQPRRPRTTAIVALIKGDRMEWCVQKLVELGVDEIIPVQTARAVVKLSGKRATSRRDRLEAIANDAARQCRRSTVATVAPVCSLAEALEVVEQVGLRLVFATGARDRSLGEVLEADGARPEAVAFAVGPEGGFTPEEVASLEEAGFAAVGLGPRVLRAETAAIAALTAIGYALGDLR
jgi:16S rRNA (uracil1498-N3)-methyltransferase